jgi:hypothetical protein
MKRWQIKDRLTQEQVDNKEVPPWASSMVDNYRRLAKIPKEVSNWDLFEAIEEEEVCLYDDEQDQIDILKSRLLAAEE